MLLLSPWLPSSSPVSLVKKWRNINFKYMTCTKTSRGHSSEALQSRTTSKTHRMKDWNVLRRWNEAGQFNQLQSIFVKLKSNLGFKFSKILEDFWLSYFCGGLKAEPIKPLVNHVFLDWNSWPARLSPSSVLLRIRNQIFGSLVSFDLCFLAINITELSLTTSVYTVGYYSGVARGLYLDAQVHPSFSSGWFSNF